MVQTWEERDIVLSEANEKPSSVTHTSVWDCVEQAWAGPFPSPRVYDQYLRKQAVICSGCNYMSNRASGDIRNHVALVFKQADEHQGAELSTIQVDARGTAYQICSGCGGSFQVGQGMVHINRKNSEPLSHGYVEALLIQQFALTRSDLVVLGREVITEGPVTSQVAQIASPRKRRRRRRNKHDDRD